MFNEGQKGPWHMIDEGTRVLIHQSDPYTGTISCLIARKKVYLLFKEFKLKAMYKL